MVERHDVPDTHSPRSWVTAGGTWPTGPFRAGTPVEVRYSAAIVHNALAHSARAVDVVAGPVRLSAEQQSAVSGALAGDLVLDLPLIVTLEQALGASLWPTRAQLEQLRSGRA